MMREGPAVPVNEFDVAAIEAARRNHAASRRSSESALGQYFTEQPYGWLEDTVTGLPAIAS